MALYDTLDTEGKKKEVGHINFEDLSPIHTETPTQTKMK